MKLSIAQALATILNIQTEDIAATPDAHAHQIFTGTFNGIAVKLGQVGVHTLEQAIWKAMEVARLQDESSFAIFPIGSHRENIYMAIERELLRQEQALEGPMWKQLGDDPRQLVTIIMEQLRDCATGVVNPSSFQIALLRVCCICIASMQWVSDWLATLKVRAATLVKQREEKEVKPPAPLDPPEPPVQPVAGEPPVSLFGAGGVGAIKVVPDPDEPTHEETIELEKGGY